MPKHRSTSDKYLRQKGECYSSIGNQVRLLRKSQDLTIADLAELTGFSDRHIAQTERAERNIPIYSLHEIAQSLGVKASDLLRLAGY